MKVADLYIRVSTDEQADKGYSQRDQEERLKRYCEVNAIQVRQVIFEDHSAKTFSRPRWIQLLSYLRKHKFQSDFVLFTKWDRFSRNAGDAYSMISILRELGAEPQAVEQPLDLSIPENKMMLAFYLAAPEVENDRRSLNILYGMRRARKEGRWVSTAPLGYKNVTDEKGKKIIVPHEVYASVIQNAFAMLAEGILAADHIRKLMIRNGLKCSRSNFCRLIRNPAYCGQIFIPKLKDEECQIVTGLHEPLITEKLFYDVQEVLDGNRKKSRGNTKANSHEMLPLRGFLICPKCNRMLTGSGSKGRNKVHYYYHCLATCGCRFKADVVNDAFINQLSRFVMKPAVIPLFKSVIKENYRQRHSINYDTSKKITEDIKQVEERLAKGRELLLAGDIDGSDYKSMKAEGQEKLRKLEAGLADSMEQQKKRVNIDKLIDSAVSVLTKLDYLYSNSNVDVKRKLVGSIFSEKICFDGIQYRTASTNEVISLIYLINSELYETKNGKEKSENFLSRLVERTGIEPVIPP